MKSLYEILHIDLAQEYTKERKLAAIDKLSLNAELEATAKAEVALMDIPESDERYHWIKVIAARAATDLLTLGKVQPEHMMQMAALPEDDFKECVKIATGSARALNTKTVDAEKELNTDTIPEVII